MPDDTEMSMVERLRLAISSTGLSTAAVARACAIPYRTLQNYLLENRAPSADVLQKLCVSFKINANWLFTGAGNIFYKDVDNKCNYSINQLLLEKVIESVEVSEITSAIYYSPQEKATAISLIYAEFSELIESHPAEMAPIIHDKIQFGQAVSVFLIKQMVHSYNLLSGRLSSDDELRVVPLDIIPEHLRPKLSPEYIKNTNDIRDLMRDVEKRIDERGAAEARGEYESPFESRSSDTGERVKSAGGGGNGEGLRAGKGRTSTKGRT